MTELSKYKTELEYLPKKEREALKKVRNKEKSVESVAEALIRHINLAEGHSIKGLRGRR